MHNRAEGAKNFGIQVGGRGGREGLIYLMDQDLDEKKSSISGSGASGAKYFNRFERCLYYFADNITDSGFVAPLVMQIYRRGISKQD